MTKQDSVRREVLLALFASPTAMETHEVCKATGRSADDVQPVLEDFQFNGILRYDHGYELYHRVAKALTIVARGSAPLDRHVAEALAVREGRL